MELAQRLAALTGHTAPAECHRGWAGVGTIEEPAAVLRALTKLEQRREAELAVAVGNVGAENVGAENEARILDEALADHRARRAWLELRAAELEAA